MIHGKIIEDLNRLTRMDSKAGGGVFLKNWGAGIRIISFETTTIVPQADQAKANWSYYAVERWKERIDRTDNSGILVSTTPNRFVWDGKVIMVILDHTNGLNQENEKE